MGTASFRAAIKPSGRGGRDTLRVEVSNDDAPREGDLPEELAKALRADKVAKTSFESLSPSHRKEYARYVSEAKKPETRARRVGRTMEMLVAKTSSKKR